MRERILAESEKYEKIIEDWVKKKPEYTRRAEQLKDKISALKQQIEDLIIERIGDREHAEIYNNMIAKREEEIKSFESKITELAEYDKVCKLKKEQLKSTKQLLDEILTDGVISDVNLRMLVKQILIHQNEDKSLDIKIEMNGDFDGSASVFLDKETA